MRTHVFVVSSAGGASRDLTPGDYDAPPFSLGGPTDYAFSPDSNELAFVSNHDKVEATSTNADVWLIPVKGGTPKNLTAANHGYDGSPQFSPDGRYLAYRSQVTPGYESDRLPLDALRSKDRTSAVDQREPRLQVSMSSPSRLTVRAFI